MTTKHTEVVHVNDAPADAVYVGRRMFRSKNPAARAGSPFGNPFKVGRDGDILTVLRKYAEHVQSRPELMALLPTLRGKFLACWCCFDTRPVDAPLDQMTCHAQVLARMADGAEPLPS